MGSAPSSTGSSREQQRVKWINGRTNRIIKIVDATTWFCDSCSGYQSCLASTGARAKVCEYCDQMFCLVCYVNNRVKGYCDQRPGGQRGEGHVLFEVTAILYNLSD